MCPIECKDAKMGKARESANPTCLRIISMKAHQNVHEIFLNTSQNQLTLTVFQQIPAERRDQDPVLNAYDHGALPPP